jgi:hypothetical protein
MYILRTVSGAALLPCLLALAGCNGVSSEPAPTTPAGPPSFVVTTTGTHVTTSPQVGMFIVQRGGTPGFAVSAEEGYTVATSTGGTCPGGSWNAGTYVTGPITADCSLDFGAALIVYSVAPSADAGVTATPGTAQTVVRGAAQTFALAPAPGFLVSVDGTCPAGTLSAGTYVTGPVTSNCTVHFGATLAAVTVSGSGDAHTAVSPGAPQTVNYGATQAFSLAIATGYRATVGGTCPAGNLVGSIYTTGAVLANCTVSVTSTLLTSMVTPSGDAHVNLAPNTVQTVNFGATQAFTVTPVGGYTLLPVGGTCPAGSFVASTYTTGAVTASCTVSFASLLAWSGVRQQGAASATTEGMNVVTDGAGNVFIAGFTEGVLNGNAMQGARDAFVAKYDASGSLVWQRNLGDASTYTTGSSLAVDSAGNAVIGGYTDAGLGGNPAPTGQDYFIAKYGADGTLLWVRQAGANSQTSSTNGLATDSAGDIYIAGNTTGGLAGNAQNGTWDGFIAKYGPDGTLAWLKQYGTPGVQSFGDRVAVDAVGNAFIAGTTRGGLAGNTLSGLYDYVLAKYDASGNRSWLRQSGVASQITTGSGVAVTASGDVLFVGNTTGGLHGRTMNGTQDYFLARFDTDGTLTRFQQVGKSSVATGVMNLSLDAVGNALVAGFTFGGLGGNVLTGVHDAFIAKHAADGTLTWVRQLGAAGVLTAGNGVAADASGNVFVGGYTEGGLAGNAVTGSRDYWLAKYGAAGALQ